MSASPNTRSLESPRARTPDVTAIGIAVFAGLTVMGVVMNCDAGKVSGKPEMWAPKSVEPCLAEQPERSN